MDEKSDRQHLRWILKSKSHTTSIRVLSEWHLIHRRSQFHDWRNRLRQTQSEPSGEIWLGWNDVDSMDLALGWVLEGSSDLISGTGMNQSRSLTRFRTQRWEFEIPTNLEIIPFRIQSSYCTWHCTVTLHTMSCMPCCLNSVMVTCNFLNELQMGIGNPY